MAVNGKVSSVDSKGAVVILSDGIECYLRASDISRQKVEDASNVLKEGDPVDAIVVNVSRKTGEINISIKAKEAFVNINKIVIKKFFISLNLI